MMVDKQIYEVVQAAKDANFEVFQTYLKLADKCRENGNENGFQYWFKRAYNVMWDNYQFVEDINKLNNLEKEGEA